MNSRERVLKLIEGEPVDRLPVMPITMMFAADRIGVPYGRYALDHRVLVEAQLHTAAEFGFDHVSAITETREAPDCGAPTRYFENQPYAMDENESLLADKGVLSRLRSPDPSTAKHMRDRLDALALLKRRAGEEKIIEGWVEGPCGASADLRGINRLMMDFFDDPLFIRELFEFVVDLAIRFGRAQVEAGADLIGIGDPVASLVGPQIYEDMVWEYQKKLVDELHAAGALVRLHICGNTRPILADMGRLGCEIVDLDSAAPLREARAAMGAKQVLLGNLDPVRVLHHGTPGEVLAAVEECHRAAGEQFIVGAGCEVVRDTPAENVHALLRYAEAAKREL